MRMRQLLSRLVYYSTTAKSSSSSIEGPKIPHIYPMPWTFWTAPGKPTVPQRYLDLTEHVSEREIARSAQKMWSTIIKQARSGKLKDPWAGLMTEYDALYGNKWEKIKRMFPGLPLGVGAFCVYYVSEQLFTTLEE